MAPKLKFIQCYPGGAGDAVFALDGEVFLVGGTDQTVRVYTAANEEPVKDIDVKGDVIALDVNGDTVASGDSSGSASLHILKPSSRESANKKALGSQSAFHTLVRRNEDPITAVAFAPNGLRVAVGCEDGSVRVHSTSSSEMVALDVATTGAVLNMRFDHAGELLAVANARGTLCVYDTLNTDAKAVTLSCIPVIGPKSVNTGCKVSWSPDGTLLAVPAKKDGDIALFQRGKWDEPVRVLSGEHRARVTHVEFHPSGSHIASCTEDGEILVWSMKSGASEKRWKHDEGFCALTWHPKQMQLLVLDLQGRRAIIPVPLQHTVGAVPSAAHAEMPSFTDEEFGAIDPPLTSVTTPPPAFGRTTANNNMSPVSVVPRASLEPVPAATPMVVHAPAVGCEPQPAFQVNGTPAETKRQYLSWTLLGKATVRRENTKDSIVVEYSDVPNAPKRPIRLTNSYGFTIACIGVRGILFASPVLCDDVISSKKKESTKIPSTVYYRYHVPWVRKNDWTLTLPLPEEATCLATGETWVAVGTSSNNVRLLSTSGLEMGVLCAPGRIVTMCAEGDLLIVVYHSAAPIADTQQLSWMVVNMGEQSSEVRGNLPLSTGSSLTWIGYTEGGLLGTIDSAGAVRLFTDLGWSLFTSLEHTDALYMWPIGITATEVVCVTCSPKKKFPEIGAKGSVVKVAPLRVATCGRAPEEEYFRTRILSAASQAATKEEGIRRTAVLDTLLLKQIQEACRVDDQLRALELVLRLSLVKSITIAGEVASIANCSILKSKIDAILQQKLQGESSSEGEEDGDDEDESSSEDEAPPARAAAPARRAEPVVVDDNSMDAEDAKAIRRAVPAIARRPNAPKPRAPLTHNRPVGVPSPDGSEDEEEEEDDDSFLMKEVEEPAPVEQSAKTAVPRKRNPFSKKRKMATQGGSPKRQRS